MNIVRMHGAGNSFVVVNNMDCGLERSCLSALARELCTKYGTDGILVAVPAEDPRADFGMLYYNADGSLGEMCGNGARCIARYGYEYGLSKDPEQIRILATAGIVTGRRVTEDRYEIRLNDPSVAEAHRMAVPSALPKTNDAPHLPDSSSRLPDPSLRSLNPSLCLPDPSVTALFSGEPVDCAYVELGCPGIPHAVVQVPERVFAAQDALRELGRGLRYSPAFPRGANVTFVCATGENSVRAITFERGVEDFTLACGTGCGATAVSFALRGLLTENRIDIDMPGGHLSVCFKRDGDRIYDLLLTGPTAYIA